MTETEPAGDSVADVNIRFAFGPNFSASEWHEDGVKIFKSATVNGTHFDCGDFAQLFVDEGEPFLVRLIKIYQAEGPQGQEEGPQVGAPPGPWWRPFLRRAKGPIVPFFAGARGLLSLASQEQGTRQSCRVPCS